MKYLPNSIFIFSWRFEKQRQEVRPSLHFEPSSISVGSFMFRWPSFSLSLPLLRSFFFLPVRRCVRASIRLVIWDAKRIYTPTLCLFCWHISGRNFISLNFSMLSSAASAVRLVGPRQLFRKAGQKLEVDLCRALFYNLRQNWGDKLTKNVYCAMKYKCIDHCGKIAIIVTIWFTIIVWAFLLISKCLP